MRNLLKMASSCPFLNTACSFGESVGRKTCGGSLDSMSNRGQFGGVLAAESTLEPGHILVDAIVKANDDFPR